MKAISVLPRPKRTAQAAFTFVLVLLMIPRGGEPKSARGEEKNKAPSAKPTVPEREETYQKTVLPLVKRFCLECHSGEKAEAEIDMNRFARWEEVRAAPTVWQKVREMLETGQMPPKDSPHPGAEEARQLLTWVRDHLRAEASAHAGDPGPVRLRRLNNAEYSYTLQDLTQVALQPAKTFPTDSAAGEGFTNTGNALVMSPALLTKYLDAGKQTARHLVLLPEGFRFSTSTARGDWINETLGEIRHIYQRHSSKVGATRVNLQGIVFDTNDGGRLPLELYFHALFTEHGALVKGNTTLEAVASKYQLNPKYLRSLWKLLHDSAPSLLLDGMRSRWRQAIANPKPEDISSLLAFIEPWQASLFRFQNVGHLQPWMVPAQPLTARRELRGKVSSSTDEKDIVLHLSTGTAGDGAQGDVVVWRNPRLVIPGQPDLPLRAVRGYTRALLARRDELFASSSQALRAAAELPPQATPIQRADLARKFQLPPAVLDTWLDFLGIGKNTAPDPQLLTQKLNSASGYHFITGWGSYETPLVLANSSDQHVRIPGNAKPRGLVVHPSPSLQVVISWRSPTTDKVRVHAAVTHAHPECGNGVAWSLDYRQGLVRRVLVRGNATGGAPGKFSSTDVISVRPGDLISLAVGPRDGNHACDLTDVEFHIESTTQGGRNWNVREDLVPDLRAGNPHSDRFGNPNLWYLHTEPASGLDNSPIIPPDSLLARWLASENRDEKNRLADALQQLLTGKTKVPPDHPDFLLYRQLSAPGGPLLARVPIKSLDEPANLKLDSTTRVEKLYGMDEKLFGRDPGGGELPPNDLCITAPAIFACRLPADWVNNSEWVADVELHPTLGKEGSVQVSLGTNSRADLADIWSDTIVQVSEESPARARFEKAFADFRQWFPPALCYAKIVPVDEVITLTLYHREDEFFCRLMLDEPEKNRLDYLWRELRFISEDALTIVDAYHQLMEYATQDSDPRKFEQYRKPLYEQAAAFRKEKLASEPHHVQALLSWASGAFRRPLLPKEREELQRFYQQARKEAIPHDETMRLLLARILVAPAFLYRLEAAAPGVESGPVNDHELATRMSYFLWSSVPDAELRACADAGKLHLPEVLLSQTRRMARDPRIRRLATEFFCQWLHIYQFDTLDEKSEKHFPTFAEVRGPLYEEVIRCFTDICQNDRSILDIVDADYTFVNGTLAKHYGLQGINGENWRRVEGMRQRERGGVLGFGATLAKQSGASRTSPILRGTWISEVLLGEKLPRPPKDVPQLPEDESATAGLTVRQLVEKHSSDPRCAVCHARVDPYGFALESFDAIGRHRVKDLANRPLDTSAKLRDGTTFVGSTGLRRYLLTQRRDAITRQFCRKLLGYALGRGVILSDEPLLDTMQQELARRDYRISAVFETIVNSRAFREIRGRAMQNTTDH